jgi:hypothetical protein
MNEKKRKTDWKDPEVDDDETDDETIYLYIDKYQTNITNTVYSKVTEQRSTQNDPSPTSVWCLENKFFL